MNDLILNLKSNKHFFSLHPELRNMILCNIKKCKALENGATHITGRESVDQLLFRGFAWPNTDERGSFWCRVYSDIRYFQVSDDS